MTSDALEIHREVTALMRKHGFRLAADWFRVGDLDVTHLMKWRNFDARRVG